ncbi:MAG: TIR domain-containing protein [Anaerolineae bacterium]|nr:TIR domain-containing protein [Anaerolineae bacterium]
MSLQVFISYKSEYREFARAVKNRIREWGYGTWFDVDDIAEGTYFRHAIQDGLEKSEVMVGLLTADAFRSREVQAEWDYFFIKNKEFIPLRYQEVEPPYHLLTIQYIDFIKDEAAAFDKLHKRLAELASTLQKEAAAPSTPGAVANETDLRGGEGQEETPTTETVDQEKRRREAVDESVVNIPPPKPTKPITPAAQPADDADEGEAKQDVLDDFLSTTPASPAERVEEPVLEDGLFSPPPAPITQPTTAPITPAAPVPQPIGGLQPPANAPVAQPQRQPVPPMPQPASRAKSSPMIWPLAAVASVIVVVGIIALIALNTNITASAVPPEGGTSPVIWVALFTLLAIAVVAVWWYFIQSRKPTAVVPFPGETPGSEYSVANIWENTIRQASLLAQPAAYDLQAALRAILRHKQYGDYNLPQSTVLLKIFEDANRELLILGDRATRLQLLQQLAHELAQSGSSDGSIPVQLSLSSWDDQLSLADWLTEKLKEKYGLPVEEAALWIKEEKLILLLDGLDETVEWYKASCIDALNTFRQQHPKIDWVLGSQASDFNLLTTQLDVSTAIVVPEN